MGLEYIRVCLSHIWWKFFKVKVCVKAVPPNLCTKLTHQSLEKKATLLQATLSNILSRMETYVFWSLFLIVIRQHWFSDKGFVSPDNKPLSEPMLTHTLITTWLYFNHNDLTMPDREWRGPEPFSMLSTVPYFDGLVQERCNSIANALELRFSCTNSSIII